MKQKKSKRNKIIAVTIILVITMFIAGVSLNFYLSYRESLIYYLNKAFSLLKEAPRVGRSSRLLVFAPHCDDEILGPGGILQRASEVRATTKVVLMTNGDGFKFMAVPEFSKWKISAESYKKIAYIRQKESILALGTVGVKKENIIFLGYPDGGLAKMWDENWEFNNLFVSGFTKDNYSPYTNSYTFRAPYCGRSVLRDVKNVIKEYKPTDIFVPHPNDTHPDHWGTNCFVLMALEELGYERSISLKSIYTYGYLVHRGDWPQPRGESLTLPLVPPEKLLYLDTEWKKFNLDVKESKHKLHAIFEYRTQMKIMARYLMSFARKNELFGIYPPLNLEKVNKQFVHVDGKPEEWKTLKPVILDPAEDVLASRYMENADLTRIYACCDENNIYLRVEIVGNIDPSIKYRLFFHPFEAKEVQLPSRAEIDLLERGKYYVEKRKGFKGLKVIIKSDQHGFELAIPKKLFGEPRRIFISTNTSFKGEILDFTASRILRL